MMAVSDAKPGMVQGRKTIDSLQVIRLILDYAKDSDEAVSLIKKYNIDFSGGPPLHYLIADSSGNSKIIEFINRRTIIIENKQPWQVSTNFVITKDLIPDSDSPCWRFNLSYRTLNRQKGSITDSGAMALLKDVSQANTIWSAVYNFSTGSIRLVMGRKYNQVHQFWLKMDGFGK